MVGSCRDCVQPSRALQVSSRFFCPPPPPCVLSSLFLFLFLYSFSGPLFIRIVSAFCPHRVRTFCAGCILARVVRRRSETVAKWLRNGCGVFRPWHFGGDGLIDWRLGLVSRCCGAIWRNLSARWAHCVRIACGQTADSLRSKKPDIAAGLESLILSAGQVTRRFFCSGLHRPSIVRRLFLPGPVPIRIHSSPACDRSFRVGSTRLRATPATCRPDPF